MEIPVKRTIRTTAASVGRAYFGINHNYLHSVVTGAKE